VWFARTFSTWLWQSLYVMYIDRDRVHVGLSMGNWKNVILWSFWTSKFYFFCKHIKFFCQSPSELSAATSQQSLKVCGALRFVSDVQKNSHGHLNVVCRTELERLIAEQQRATELVMEKEEELYGLHESHLTEIAAQRNHLDQLKAQHEAERDAAWQEIELQRQILKEQQAIGRSEFYIHPHSVLWCCWLGDRKGILYLLHQSPKVTLEM